MFNFKIDKISVFILSAFAVLAFIVPSGVSYAGISELQKEIQGSNIADEKPTVSDCRSAAETTCGNTCENTLTNLSADGISAAGDAAKNIATGVKSIKKGVKNLFQGLKDIFKSLADIFKQLVSDVKDAFGSIFGEVKSAGEEIGKSVEAVGKSVQDAGTSVSESVKAAGEEISGAVNKTSDNIIAVGSEISSGSISGASSSSSGPAAGTDGVINLRTAPWGDVMGSVANGAKIEVIENCGNWSRVKVDGKEGFVYSSMLPAGTAKTEETTLSSTQNIQQAASNAATSEVKTASAGTPYFCQYDNEYFSASTCQNTSVAMVLAKYGWKENPDSVTKRFGKDMAQTPKGLEYVFNSIAETDGIKARVRSHENGSMELINKLLAEGKPVIAHGWFTKSGHVVTITGFDGENYTVNDPAGKWNQNFKGGYSDESGQGVKYSKAAMTEALVENGEVWCHEIYNVE